MTSGYEKKNCLLCGNEFTPRNGRQVYCSKTCRKLARKQRDNAKIPPFRVCKRCGKPYLHKGKILQLCDECREQYYKTKWKEKAERQKQLMAERTPKPNRKCHDCGKPTWDYRCEECRKKWRAKNRVPENWASLSDEEDAHVLL